MNEKVLVTGGNGFLGMHIIAQLLARHYQVRATLRSLDKQAAVRETLAANHVANLSQLEFVKADLSVDDGWQEAMTGVQFVLSVASPVFFGKITDEKKAIQPAINGVTRIIKAAQNAGVQKMVMTANFGGVGFSNFDKQSITDETYWTDPEQPGLSLYEKSKLLAEKAAWKIINQPGNQLAFSTINPVAILGPAMSAHVSGSFGILENLMNGSLKRVPNISLNIVDVRDVAKLHILAMETPAADGQRFIATNDGQITMPEMAAIIRKAEPELANKVPGKRMPDWLIKTGALVSQQAREAKLLLEINRNVSNQKARKMLGWQPMATNEGTVLATLAAMRQYGLL